MVEVLLGMIEPDPKKRWSADRCLSRGLQSGFLRAALALCPLRVATYRQSKRVAYEKHALAIVHRHFSGDYAK